MRENEGLIGIWMALQKLPGDWSRNWGLGGFGAKGSGLGVGVGGFLSILRSWVRV